MEEISEAEKRSALEKVLGSRTFEKSGRARDLLAYVVEQDIAGEADGIKGFTIAMDVFGRDESFDAASDPLVRVQAGRLRDYLKDYYSGEGASDPVIISVPRGGYRPAFELTDGPSVGAGAGAQVSSPHPGSSAPRTVSNPTASSVERHQQDGTPELEVSSSDGAYLNQLRWVWAAVAGLFMAIAALVIFFFVSVPESGDAVLQPGGVSTVDGQKSLPVLRVFHEGNTPEVLFSARQLSEIVSKFDMVTTTAMAPASEITSRALPWGDLEYAFRLYELPAVSIDGPKQIRFELLHLATLTVLRAETYPADIWSSPNLTLIAASKLNATANPGGIIFADMVARGTQTPVTECLQLVKRYYERRVEERHRVAYECTARLQEAPFAGGTMLATNGGLTAEAVGKGYQYDDLPTDRDAALEVALQRALAGVDLAPSSARAAREVGFVRSWRGEMARMGDWFRRAYELNPCDTSIAASYGYGLVLEGDFRKAVQVYEAAVEATTRHPTWWDFYYSLALLMDDRLEEAKRAAEPLASKDRNLFYAVLNASLAFESGNAHLAAKMVREIRERFPEFVENPEGRFAKRHLPQVLVDRLVEVLRASGL